MEILGINISKINIMVAGVAKETITLADTNELIRATRDMYWEIDMYLANRRIFERSWNETNKKI